jgi:uncharacterized membrane protein
MIRHVDSIEIDRPVGEVFAYIDDEQNTPKWLQRCTGLVRTSAGPKKVGSTLHYTYQQGKREGTMEGSVTAHEVNRRLAMHFKDAMMEVDVGFRFFDRGENRTEVQHGIEINTKTFVAIMMRPLISIMTRKNTHRDLTRLKELLEAS